MIDIRWQPTRRELRQFALLLAGFLLAAAVYTWWRHHWVAGAWSATIGAVAAAVVGLLAPQMLRVLYVGWMCLVFPIAWLVSHLVMAVIFFGVITPVGLIVRVIRGDLLQRRFDRETETYWVPHKPSEEPRRYFQQF